MAKSSYPSHGALVKPKRRPWYVYFFTMLISFCLITTGVVIYIWKVNPGGISASVIWNRANGTFHSKREFNMIIAGLDYANGGNRTDSLMVAHINVKDKFANLVSIPRDSRVEIAGHDRLDKINAAFSSGGPELTMDTVQQFLNVPIDYYIVFRIDGVKKVLEALGGIDIDVEKNMKYKDRSQGLYIDLRRGFQHLNADQAVGYSRFRHDAEGDFGRIRRQQQVLNALAKKATTSEVIITKLPRLLPLLIKKQLVETNLSLSDAYYLANLYDKQLSNNLKMIMLPGTPETIHGISYVIPDAKEIPYVVGGLLKGGFHPSHRLVKVLVMNGCGSPMIAQIYQQRLTYYGFDVIGTENARDFDHERSTVVVLKKNPFSESIAKLINADIEYALNPEAVQDMNVVIGKDKLNE